MPPGAMWSKYVLICSISFMAGSQVTRRSQMRMHKAGERHLQAFLQTQIRGGCFIFLLH